MAEPRPLPPPDPEPATPSLLGRVSGLRPRLRIGWRAALVTAALSVTLSAALLTMGEARRIEAATVRLRNAPVALAPAASRGAPLSAILAAFGHVLPNNARLANLAWDGRLSATVETTEPDRLREALATAPSFTRLRTTGEAALDDGGYRVTLEEPQ